MMNNIEPSILTTRANWHYSKNGSVENIMKNSTALRILYDFTVFFESYLI